jgi:hypothetical protein
MKPTLFTLDEEHCRLLYELHAMRIQLQRAKGVHNIYPTGMYALIVPRTEGFVNVRYVGRKSELRGVVDFLSMFNCGSSSSIKKNFAKIATLENYRNQNQASTVDAGYIDTMFVENQYDVYENVNRISTIYDNEPKLVMFCTVDGVTVREVVSEIKNWDLITHDKQRMVQDIATYYEMVSLALLKAIGVSETTLKNPTPIAKPKWMFKVNINQLRGSTFIRNPAIVYGDPEQHLKVRFDQWMRAFHRNVLLWPLAYHIITSLFSFLYSHFSTVITGN